MWPLQSVSISDILIGFACFALAVISVSAELSCVDCDSCFVLNQSNTTAGMSQEKVCKARQTCIISFQAVGKCVCFELTVVDHDSMHGTVCSPIYCSRVGSRRFQSVNGTDKTLHRGCSESLQPEEYDKCVHPDGVTIKHPAQLTVTSSEDTCWHCSDNLCNSVSVVLKVSVYCVSY